jgi:integral membrane protein (TIGR01906 family)
MQIEPLGLEEETGYTYDEIKEGYDEVLDFLTRPGGEFSAGVFEFSEEGASHFEDCKVLFTLNGVVLIVSSVLIAVLLILRRKGIYNPTTVFKRAPRYYSGIATLVGFAVIGVLAATNFDNAFRIFHKIFFPGKDNWMFNPYTDEIIMAMPQQFFMNCAILTVVSIITISTVFILTSKNKEYKKH